MEGANGCRVIHTMGRNNCGGRCIIHAHVRDGKIEQLTEDRLRYPMKRVGRRG